MRLLRGAPALLQIARRAGGGDILPRRAPAEAARDDMIEGQILARPAILAREAVAQEQVEARERRMLRQYVKPSQYPAFTRFNLFLRDRFACQYCGSGKDLTFDHVVPRRLGGRTTWENVATACAPCNLKKGGRTPQQAHMPLYQQPWRPTSWQLQDNGRAFPPGYLHESWIDWLYWDVELEG